MRIEKINQITNQICGDYPAKGVETTAQAGWAGVFNACLEAGRICRAQGGDLGWDVEAAAEAVIKAANAAGFRANG